ncbi:MAG: alkaline phosphatase family protein [Ardenticatenaceae bacterium]|nr:alkaline phosphatase family protein [Ardenticatenaceae bacterium]
MTNPKLLVIGLDGADWRVLQPAIDAGHLPVLAQLQREGSYGRLNSTIRPESSVAWSTFATGVNPGKHGVYGFVRHEPQSYNFSLANSKHIALKRFWDYLGEAGQKTGLLNIPFTYPPQKVNGFLIGGMLTPGAHVPFTFPSELQEKVLGRIRPFMFDAGDGEQTREAVVSRVFAYTKQQLELALWLLQEEAWDCFTVVFTGLDRLQHFAWGGEDHLAHLQQLDKAIEQILAVLPADTMLFILSDHGFGGVANRFYINRWLQDEGYLTLRASNPLQVSAGNWLSWLRRVPLLVNLKQRFLPAAWGPTQLKTAAFGQAIDWPQTKVYYAPDGGLRINLRGREPDGIVAQAEYDALRAELVNKLSQLRDSGLDQCSVAAVYLKEQLYNGPFAHLAPDLIVEPQRNNVASEQNYILDGKLDAETAVSHTAHPYNGNHASQGIFLAWAPETIAPKRVADIDLQDIAPTILAALHSPIPAHMDGRVLNEIFVSQKSPTPSYFDDSFYETIAHMDADARAADDMTKVEERLRKLGYLD